MLILARKVDQSILLDGGIRITVVKIDGKTVRLGVDAPKDVGIVREELVQRDDEEGRSA